MTGADRYELNVAAWLHDCGKITTPEYVIDKSTKLETICDRIDLVEARFEIAEREAAVRALSQRLRVHGLDDNPHGDEQFRQEL